MKPGDSTAIVGRTISEIVEDLQFNNLYLQGDKESCRDEGRCKTTVMGFGKKTISGVFRYFTILLMHLKLYKNKPALIIAHRYKCVDISDMLSRLYNVPLVVVVHGVGEFDRAYRNRKLNALIKRGVTIVCVSKYVEKYVRGQLQKEVAEKMADGQLLTIENSINFAQKSSEQFSREEARKKLGLSSGASGKLLVGYVGRLANVKGVADVVKAAVCTEDQHLHFVIVGDGPLAAELKEMSVSTHAEVNLSFSGFVLDAYQYFRAFDFIVLPSRSEGFPLTLLEAVAARVPFITTDIEVYREVIGEDGVFYTPGDIDALCEKISLMSELSQSGELLDFGNKQGSQIASRYPFTAFVESYSCLLKGLV